MLVAAAATGLFAAAFVVDGWRDESPRSPGRSTTADRTASGPAGRSPLADYLGFGHDPVEDERQFNRDIEQRERFISVCMSDAGFTYEPLPPDTAYVPTTEGAVEVGPAPQRARRAQQRNEKYVAGLGADERAAYWVAFHGFPHNRDGFTRKEVARYDVDGDGEASFDEVSGDACLGRSEGAVRGVFAARIAIGADVDRLQGEIDALVASSGALDRLVTCVAEAGAVLTTDTVIAILAADPGLRGRPGVPDCVASYSATVDELRVEPETRFFEEHEDVIRELGRPR